MQEPFLCALRVLLFHNINMRADRGWPMYQCIHHSIISQGEYVSGISDLSPTCFPAHFFHAYPRVLTDPNISCLYLKVFGAYTVPHQQLEKVIPPAISLTLELKSRIVTDRGAQQIVSVHSGCINLTHMFIDHACSFTFK